MQDEEKAACCPLMGAARYWNHSAVHGCQSVNTMIFPPALEIVLGAFCSREAKQRLKV